MTVETRRMSLRIPEAQRARLEIVAKQAGMSMNAEILRRLERSFKEDAATLGRLFDNRAFYDWARRRQHVLELCEKLRRLERSFKEDDDDAPN